MNFDPADYVEGPLPLLDRPKFLAIVSSNTLATTMLRRATGPRRWPGHREPHRRRAQCAAARQTACSTPTASLSMASATRSILPDCARWAFLSGWPAATATRKSLRYALDQGAAGVQVGTAFAFSEESGMRPDLKNELLAQAVTSSGVVFTDPLASPTGFPFKVAQLQGSYSDPAVAEARTRVCDIGLLRESYIQPNGNIGYRCSAEPVANYVAKGGKVEETVGRKCLCNALMANIGHAQMRKDGAVEPPLVTVGDDLNTVAQFLAPGRTSYSAADVVRSLLSLSGRGRRQRAGRTGLATA